MNMYPKSLIFLFIFCLFTSEYKCNDENEYEDLESRLKMTLKSMSRYKDRQIFDGADMNEMLEVVFSFIQAVVALSTTFEPGANQQLEVETPWTEWSSCSKSCDGGIQTRMRNCPHDHDQSDDIPDIETKAPYGHLLTMLRHELKKRSCIMAERECNHEPCEPTEPTSDPDSFSEWTDWSFCHQRRSRACSNIEICTGSDQEIRPCEVQRNDIWNPWTQWSSCPVTCGQNGKQTRIRVCNTCAIDDQVDREYRSCNPQPRPCTNISSFPIVSWAQWEPWSSCSSSCGNGEQIRRRICARGRSRMCQGSNLDRRICDHPCTGWSSWTWISSCSVTCGNGTRQRSRMCMNGDCIGSSFETVLCSKPC